MKFNFSKEQKATIWYTDAFTVEAETQEEAERIFIEACKNGDEMYHDSITFDYSEPIFETYESMSLKDNNMNSTIELYDEGYNLIWENKDEN